MTHAHSIIWIDHHKAVVWNFADDEQSKLVVKAHDQHGHTHLRQSPHGGHKSPLDHEFFADVVKTLAGVREILVIGPAQAKDEFAGFVRSKHPDIGRLIVAVESADHPTDAELLAYARKHFKVIDRMI
jgi:stalled ribosome rescue protein Dom34